MTPDNQRHLILRSAPIREALRRLDELAADAVLFLRDEVGKVTAALTDGDVRRYLLGGGGLEDAVSGAAFADFRYLRGREGDLEKLREYRNRGFRIVPVLDGQDRLIDVINFRFRYSLLPLDAVIMAGGVGSRLRPLTDTVPKPMLKVGDKPIVEHNIDRLRAFGVRHLTISIKYLGEQIVDYFGDGSDRAMNISYVTETEPRGTIGAVSEIKTYHNDYVLVMNSDLLTTIDYEEMFLRAITQNADMVVATVPYEVKVPYGVIKHEAELVTGLVEKPTYTYYSNAGIYIIRREHLALIPKEGRYSAPDLMEALYSSGKRVVHFPITDYWLDIGKHHDYTKAQQVVGNLQLLPS